MSHKKECAIKCLSKTSKCRTQDMGKPQGKRQSRFGRVFKAFYIHKKASGLSQSKIQDYLELDITK